MKGGYQILDLSSITLVKDTETTITDLNILNQLLGLTDFLNKNGKIDKQLKPIYIITKDSAGYVSITNNDTKKLLIDGYISGLHIQLNIVYTSSLDDYGNTVYAVSSAKYTYAIVSGGTKLYKHEIRFVSDNINVLIYLVNNIKDAYTKSTFAIHTEDFNNCLSYYNDDDNIIYPLVALNRFNDSSELILYYIDDGPSFQIMGYESASIEDFADTVTPL